MYKQILITGSGIPDNMVQRVEDKACLQFDPDNKDYQEYLMWLAVGNTPQPAEE